MAGMKRNGLTLIELTIVIIIMTILAVGLVITLNGEGSSTRDAEAQLSVVTMHSVRDAILGDYRRDMKDDVLFEFQRLHSTGTSVKKRPLVLPRPRFRETVADIGRPAWNTLNPNRPSLQYLFVNPATDPELLNRFDAFRLKLVHTFNLDTKRGWRGPYLDTQRSVGRYPLPDMPEGHPDYASALVAAAERGFTTGYAEKGALVPLDAWRNPIVLTEYETTDATVPSGHYRLRADLISAGPDGNLNTSDDNIVVLVEERTERLSP
jgi:prepilin-type N-terminal cleavage/methylation domain-containing protein